MKQVININFHGQVVPIEVSAFELLKNYTASLAKFFAEEEGKEEIINDIESRIAELFQQRLKNGVTCITDDDVNAIIKSMGRPEEFETVEDGPSLGNAKASEKQESDERNYEQQSKQNTGTGTYHKRLYRDENNKVLGGVCSGLANYFGIDPVVVRIIFVIVFPFIVPYLILWVAVPSSATKEIGATRKRLFRDSDEKFIAGVCSGLGNYFGINPWIPRVIFLVPFISFVFKSWHFFDFPHFWGFNFSPGTLIVYIILWLVIPEAITTAENLEMKGEKVDLNSIKNSVVEEMKGVGQRVEKFGTEARAFAEEKSKTVGADVNRAVRRGGTSLGDIIVLIAKGFAYFIIGCVSFAAVVGLFAFAIFSIGIFPLKDFVLTDGLQNSLAWGTLLFFIAVPVIGLVTWIIRRFAKMKSNSKFLRFTFISLWVIGWACFISLIAIVGKDFSKINDAREEEIVLSNPGINKLELTTNSPDHKIFRNNFFRAEAFENVDEDTAFVNNIDVHIVKATNDSFRVTLIKEVNGRYRQWADTLANKMKFNVVQKDSLLILDKGIEINKTDKFRNQHVILTVFVPVGKQIRIDKNVKLGHNVHIEGPWNNNDFNIEVNENRENGWDEDVDYIMKADGLYTLSGKPADEYKWKQNHKGTKVSVGPNGIEINDNGDEIKIGSDGVKINDATETYRYDNTKRINQLDSAKQKVINEQQQLKDSLEKVKENIEKQIKKIGKVEDHLSTEEAMSRCRVQLYSPLSNI